MLSQFSHALVRCHAVILSFNTLIELFNGGVTLLTKRSFEYLMNSLGGAFMAPVFDA